ncbi:hypothetical protein [Psychrobacter sp. I-STPA6b]|uniref:hypothetical protein n=1 Tax=Psychrobacter sp. I-STPA6b TaxID=2585718 RepID=UPI001D0CBB70|nr:hypothetical protein [Psychrobacter sp. I-STPA6b]
MSTCKKNPNKITHIDSWTSQAVGVIYFSDFKKFIAYGGIYQYANNADEIKKQGVYITPNEEISCSLTVCSQAFTKPVNNPFTMLWQWNHTVKNRLVAYFDGQHFFKINDEIDDEIDDEYPPHIYHDRIVASSLLPLWNDRDEQDRNHL